jgi:hypothetical protein
MKKTVPFFISYAHANRTLADHLLDRLREQMIPSRSYEYRLWRDTAILVGEDWDAEIKAALKESDLGLLLLSPAFLGSPYITGIEWPHFLNEGKPVIPVMLEPVDFKRHDLHGLEAKQIFRCNPNPRAGELRAYADCDTKGRRRFCEELFSQIEQRLDKLRRAVIP